MSGKKDTKRGRLWYVLGPLSLILIGAGWLALGLAVGGMAQSQRAHAHAQARAARMAVRRQSDASAQAIRISKRPASWVVNAANGHMYRVVDATSWKAAQAAAAEAGAHLVTIDSAEEQAWLVSNMGGRQNFWIGLSESDREGFWRWEDGTPLSYRTGPKTSRTTCTDRANTSAS